MSRRQRKRRRQRHNGGGVHRTLTLALAVVLATVVIGILAVLGWIVGIAASAPSLDEIKPIDQGSVSEVFAADGKRLGFIQSVTLRTPIPESQMPPAVRDATVAIEDQRFYKHRGVDYTGLVRAAIKNLKSHKTVQGGSTITMQLVRNLYISKERTYKRKIIEAKLAEDLENRHHGRAGKEWILTEYLNNVSYGTVGGQTAVGIQAAARTFFDKPARDLTLSEAALLAGLPQAPSVYNPFREPRQALVRRNEVLEKMRSLGMITAAQAASAERDPLAVKPNHYYTERRESYFFDYVTQELVDRYGINTVRKGGLKIHTTVDLDLQKAARNAIAGQLNRPGDPSSAIVTIDPSNGYIKAMVSSGKYGKNKFNYAAQGHRQPGSTFKVMVLMTALKRGVDPNRTTYQSRPFEIPSGRPWGPWKVQTYSHTYLGRVNLVQATLKSDNTVYAQLDLDLGPETVKRTARDMGVRTKLNGYPAEGLGGLRLGVSPLEMANAYATIADGGWRNRPIAITKVVFPDGHVDQLGNPDRVKVFEDGVTAEATKILRQNILQGTGTRANIGCPAAGKTGTTDDFTDAWFVGYTPKLATAVWVGYPNSRIEMRSVHGTQVAGGTFPAMIWHDYMSVAKGSDCSSFPPPKQPIHFVPFFGKYSRTGTSADHNYYYRPTTTPPPVAANPPPAPTTGGGTGGYDPELYDSAPQGSPGQEKKKDEGGGN